VKKSWQDSVILKKNGGGNSADMRRIRKNLDLANLSDQATPVTIYAKFYVGVVFDVVR
jgi:hypothetical protein